MLLVVDVGNTHTVAGVYALDGEPGGEPAARWRWRTQRAATTDELAAIVHQMLAIDDREVGDVHRIAISSVVPALTGAWRELGTRWFGGGSTLVVDPELPSPITLAVTEPREVGADRIVNAVAAWHRYAGPCIVVDLGTATTYDVILDPATYVGGAIAPGIAISVGALVERAARLASVDLDVPDAAIGRDTASSMRSGVMLGAAAQLEGMLTRIRAELVSDHGIPAGEHVPALATGGFATVLFEHVPALDDVDADLTLRGLQLLALGG